MVRNPHKLALRLWPNHFRSRVYFGMLALALGWGAGPLVAAIGPVERPASGYVPLAVGTRELAVADVEPGAGNRGSLSSRLFSWPERVWLRIPFWVLVLALIWA